MLDLFRSAMSNRNCLLSQKLFNHHNQGRKLNDINEGEKT